MHSSRLPAFTHRKEDAMAAVDILRLDAPRAGAAFADDVRAGLTARRKRLSCRWLYDRAGSLLFEEIARLPEYYLTRAEREILERRAPEIAARAPSGASLVELGSGSAEKTRVLIEALLARRARAAEPLRFVPIDISRSMLEESSRALASTYRGLTVLGIAGEFAPALAALRRAVRGPKLVLFLGSTIGNLSRGEARRFLRRVRAALAPGDRLLVGIDLKKDRATLEAAYDDARGVTARFNRNLLTRLNRELGGRFDPKLFRHRARWSEARGCVDMHLVSARRQRVAIERLGLEVPFEEGEAIHTESSHKYAPREIDALARAAGLGVERRWLDGARRFSVNLFARA
jgi:L-histidine N-alpha-methyltransferase